MNVLSLWKSKEVIAQATGSTRHGNQYATVDESMDVKLVVSFLIEDDIFSFKPGRGTKNTEFTDLFFTGTGKIASGIPTDEYLLTARGNWKAARAKGLNPCGDITGDITETAATAAAERESRLAEESDNDI